MRQQEGEGLSRGEPWTLITKDPAMRLKYLKLKNLRGGKRAPIAIARKLLLIIRRMLLDNVPYRMTAIAA